MKIFDFIILAADATNEKTSFDKVIDSILSWLSTTGLKLVLGLVVLFIVFKIINFFSKKIEKSLTRRHVDKTIESLIVSTFRKGLKFVAFAALLGYIGFETSSIAALVASFGVGLGLALQGSLSNLAGGIIIIFMRPFKIGDYIESNGLSGTVEQIKIFYTYLVTPDNKVIMIPNGSVANGSIINYSQKDTRRVDILFSIAYENDFEKAKDIIRMCIKKIGLSLDSPEPFINVSNHGASSIDITTRVWCKSNDYWTIYWKLLEDVKLAFDEAGISIPYNQLDVHLKEK